MHVTVNDLAHNINVEYPTAMALIKLMEAQGVAKVSGKRPTLTGKGKPSTIYEIPEKFEIDFTKKFVKAA